MDHPVAAGFALITLGACAPADDCVSRLETMMAYESASFFQRELDGPEESSEGASIMQYRDSENILRRVTLTYFGERGRRVLDYRLIDAANYTLIEQSYTYDRPIDPATPTRAAAPESVMVQVCDGESVIAPETISPRLREDMSLAEDFLRDQ